MSYQFIAGLLLPAFASAASAQSPTNIAATPASTAYNQDNQGNIARSQYGLCWRTGYWTPSNSVTGCDGDLTPPIANPIAPALVSNPAALINTEQRTSPNNPDNCNFTVALSGDQTFGFGMTRLNNAANRILNKEVVERLKTCGQIDNITVTGHADRLGSQKHIQEISLKRAEAVADFLKSKNISTPIEIVGAGNNEPISHCPEKLAYKKLTSCLSPDRRVVISVQGHEK
ncbi:OmpA family protein [Herbaspirillum rhizosphaerae]|uniref:OmpA family protein n=1 Tax=Herbaspirillum rhizosphaerae TaxID=346179 RepID=A0ABW8Z4E0_9BURK